MLKPKKKITRKEMKEDKLVTTYFETRSWIEENRRLVGYIVGIPIVLVVALFLWNLNLKESNQNATAKLAKVIPYYDQGRYEEAINGAPQEGVIQGLAAIVNEHGNTDAGQIAKLYLANCYFAGADYPKALEQYLEADLEDKMLAASALSGAAACQEALKRYDEAALLFEKAASRNMTGLQAPENLHHAAANYALAGKRQRAAELLKKIKKEFPESAFARDIDRYLAQYGE
ncbi:MAG: tetratricopeptide repeat protein [Ignavibacteriales bacterium]|nr:tetratricopeptide repeat protein [Ignavibacteriales bacterium]